MGRQHNFHKRARRMGGAIKAEGVCRWVLLGVCSCAPFEEGILHSWITGLVAPTLGWG